MTPAETLAAARLSPVGPYATPRPEWLEGWTGPVEWLDTFRDPAGRWVVSAYGAGGMANGAPAERIRLDLRRPEVRDLLVRHGCPAWARDVPAAVWAWAGGAEPTAILGAWGGGVHGFHTRHTKMNTRLPGGYLPSHEAFEGNVVNGVCSGFSPLYPSWQSCGRTGRAPFDQCRACADLAALRAGCILTESDGWYVPLVGGGVGWWPREVSGG